MIGWIGKTRLSVLSLPLSSRDRRSQRGTKTSSTFSNLSSHHSESTPRTLKTNRTSPLRVVHQWMASLLRRNKWYLRGKSRTSGNDRVGTKTTSRTRWRGWMVTSTVTTATSLTLHRDQGIWRARQQVTRTATDLGLGREDQRAETILSTILCSALPTSRWLVLRSRVAVLSQVSSGIEAAHHRWALESSISQDQIRWNQEYSRTRSSRRQTTRLKCRCRFKRKKRLPTTHMAPLKTLKKPELTPLQLMRHSTLQCWLKTSSHLNKKISNSSATGSSFNRKKLPATDVRQQISRETKSPRLRVRTHTTQLSKTKSRHLASERRNQLHLK